MENLFEIVKVSLFFLINLKIFLEKYFMICIIDYELGNVISVKNAIDKLVMLVKFQEISKIYQSHRALYYLELDHLKKEWLI